MRKLMRRAALIGGLMTVSSFAALILILRKCDQQEKGEEQRRAEGTMSHEEYDRTYRPRHPVTRSRGPRGTTHHGRTFVDETIPSGPNPSIDRGAPPFGSFPDDTIHGGSFMPSTS